MILGECTILIREFMSFFLCSDLNEWAGRAKPEGSPEAINVLARRAVNCRGTNETGNANTLLRSITSISS